MALNALSGQSNMDICLQGYGTLDEYIKLLNDNKITLSTNLKSTYSIDSSLKNINTNNVGFSYATIFSS